MKNSCVRIKILVVLGFITAIFGGLVSSAVALEAQVKDYLGSPAIFIDGTPQVPMIFMGRPFIIDKTGRMFTQGWEFQLSNQIRLASKAGIHIHSIDMPHILPWATPGEKVDYSLVDKIVRLVLEADPQAMLLPRIGVSAPRWWIKKHPEQCMLYNDGKKGSNASVASKVWRREVLENLRGYIRYCEEKYGDHILGYHPCAQNTGEWFYERSWHPFHSGFEEPMRQGFAEWAKSKYGTVEKLRQAWRQPNVNFETVRVTRVEEREKASNGLFRDPVKERFVIDFSEYMQVAMVETLEKIARLIKEETKGKKLVCFFYGYCFSLSRIPKGLPTGGHLMLERLLQCPEVDILCSPIDYFDRQPGGSGPFMTVVDSVRDSGKLWLNEDDTRTYLSKYDHEDNHPEHRRIDTPEDTIWVHQRNFSNLLPRRLACWYMDLFGRSWLNSTEIWDNITRFKQIYEQEFSRPACWKPEVAVIVDERSPLYLAANRTLSGPLLSDFRKEFYRIGTGFRMNLLSDVLNGRLELPKVSLFLGCLHFTEQERTKLINALKGKTAVWFYGSGYLDEWQGSVENMEKLTGFSFTENLKGGSAAITFDGGSSLTKGLVGTAYTPKLYEPGIKFCPLWSVNNEKQLVCLAHFADGTTAAAMKDMGSWKSIYIGTAGCPAQFIRNILRESGVHIYTDSDDVLLTDGHFLSLTASAAGIKTINLPKGTILRNIYTGEILTAVDGFVRQEFELGQTRQWWIDKTLQRLE